MSATQVLGLAAPAVSDVDPALMEQLTAELERILESQGGKGIADVTGVFVDPLARTDMGNDARLEWAYNNTGDYNQDGLVSINDITTIGQHWQVQEGDASWAAASVANGNGDTVVNINDITQIGQNWLNLVPNYVVEADIDGDGTWVPVANVPQTSGVEPAEGGFLQYTTTITNGAYASEFRVFAGPEASPLHEIEVDPDAFLITFGADRTDGYTPLTARFSVNIYNADTNEVTLDIDFDDGGSDSYGPGPPDGQVFEHQFTAAGEYHVTITGQDGPGGKTSNKAIDVTVTDWPGATQLTNPDRWHSYNITDGIDYGQHNAMALVNGMPVIVYTRDDRHEIHFARATQAAPTNVAHWAKMTVDDGDFRGGTLDIIECQGVACIVYEDTTDQDIYYANASSDMPFTNLDWAIHEPDALGTMQAQLVDLSGAPAMVYRAMGGVIRFARSTAVDLPDEDTDWVFVDINSTDNHEFPRIIVADGLPAVAFRHKMGGNSELKYMFADSATPDTPVNWSLTTVDYSEDECGLGTILTTIGGLPALAYSNIHTEEFHEYLNYALATVPQPTGIHEWTMTVVRQIDDVDVGRSLCMTGYEGSPFFAYIHEATLPKPGLRASYPSTTPPTAPGHFDHGYVDEAGGGYFINGDTSSLVLADGTLAVLYRTNEGMKFAYYDPPS